MTGTACGDKNNGQNEVCFGKKKKTYFPLFFSFGVGGRVLDLVVFIGLSPSLSLFLYYFSQQAPLPSTATTTSAAASCRDASKTASGTRRAAASASTRTRGLLRRWSTARLSGSPVGRRCRSCSPAGCSYGRGKKSPLHSFLLHPFLSLDDYYRNVDI